MQAIDPELAIKRAHVTLMRHPKTALYSGIILMGESSVEDAGFTAYTDGVNKRYGKSFISKLKSDSEVRAIVLHENLHVALKHLPFGKAMFKENQMLANVAADMVVNNMIDDIKDTIRNNEPLVKLPDGALCDPQFKNWSMRQVYDYLKKECKKPKDKGDDRPVSGNDGDPQDGDDGQGDSQNDGPSNGPGSDKNDSSGSKNGNKPGPTKITINGKEYDLSDSDEHDFSKEEMTADEAKKLSEKIEKALREGGMLAGRLGAEMPREIKDLLAPKVDWRDELRDFVTSSMKGKDEFTWRKLNRRGLANDMLMPTVEDETISRLIIANDTSGSISNQQLTEYATELANICEVCQPDEVLVLWWDTKVHGVQSIGEQQYGDLRNVLKPKGGGGTRVSCVSEYINSKNMTADCVVVFTDGYVESNVTWDINAPTLWLITENDHFRPPGKIVKYNRD
jgi:predicted metal-dependent peptidase